jgi:hypothetical protein
MDRASQVLAAHLTQVLGSADPAVLGHGPNLVGKKRLGGLSEKGSTKRVVNVFATCSQHV